MSKNNYILIHGQLVEVSDDVLMHFKYIKREKKNGRWVYYYDEKAADAGATALNKQREVVRTRAEAAYNQRKKFYNEYTTHAKYSPSTADYFTSKTREHTERLNKSAEKAYKKYSRMEVRHATKKSIGKGIAAIANALSGIFGKKKK